MSKTEFVIEPGKQEYFVTREFDAPRELVFSVFTNPVLIPLWWGPRDLTTTVQVPEIKAGGVWRHVQTDAKGEQFAFHGVYHEIKVPARIVQTFEYEGWDECCHVSLEIIHFETLHGNRTRLTQQSIFPTVEERDEMVQTGMQSGVEQSMDRIQELLEKMAVHS
jgi:uncharacterized protein YndB with AHSA1/START domain